MRHVPVLVVLLAVALSLPAFGTGGATSPAPAFSVYQPPIGLGVNAGEPSIGVNPATGNVFLQAYSETLRVVFDDSVTPPTATWANVAEGPQASFINLDPILFTDQVTGRTYAGGLAGECSILAFTDDDGSTWTTMTNPCAPPAWDHETIGSGAWSEPRPASATYDRAVYYCVQFRIDQCSVSLDGGLTFQAPVLINSDLGCWGLFGHVKIAPDGTAIVPIKSCAGPMQLVGVNAPPARPGIAITDDNGESWVTRLIADGLTAPNGFDPSVAFTPSNWMYAAWTHRDNSTRVALTKDDGLTWGPTTDLSASVGVTSTIFASAVAGDDDRAAVAFIGTKGAGNAFDSSFQGTWDLYVSLTYDAGATWTTVKATSDPVQRGWVCTAGTTCTAGRNLLDFMDATIDAEGRVLVGFADGCILECAAPTGTRAQSVAAMASIARQSAGDCLYAAKCGPASGTPIAEPEPTGDVCHPNIVIFSSNSAGTPSLNSHAAVCILADFTGPAPVSTAFINPGSNQVSVRYTADLGVSNLKVVVDGLGLDEVEATMPRTVGTLGVTYDSPRLPIDPLAMGKITATVKLPDGTVVGRVAFHTAV